jgi:cytochrome c551/c552
MVFDCENTAAGVTIINTAINLIAYCNCKADGKADAVAYLTGKIKGGSSGVYGSIPMPPQSLGETELLTVATWIASGAAK